MNYGTQQTIVDVLLCLHGGSTEELAPYADLINSELSALPEPEDETRSRFIVTTAARLHYLIALAKGGSTVSKFTAGDISITEQNDETARAKALLEAVGGSTETPSGSGGSGGFDFRCI